MNKHITNEITKTTTTIGGTIKLIKRCATCGTAFKTKHKTKAYCNPCYNDRYYNTGYYLYIVMAGQQVLYVGATESIKMRLSNHLNGHSNIKELINSNFWDCIKYLDVTSLVNNREELKLLENTLIELYPNDWNDIKNIIRNVDKLREFQLLATVHSLDQEWILYCKNTQKKCLNK